MAKSCAPATARSMPRNSSTGTLRNTASGRSSSGLFTQSNYGIVTRMGVWLLPRPPALRSFHFTFPDDDDLEAIVELCRPLKLSNFVPTLFRVSNDLYLCGSEGESPEYRASQGRRAISDEGRRKLRESHGLGAWNVSGAFYGPSAAAMEPPDPACQDMFLHSSKARYHSHTKDAAAHSRLCKSRSMHFRSAEPRRKAWSSEMAARRRQYLVPARHADGRQSRQRIPASLPWHLSRIWTGLHCDECMQRTLCSRLARHVLSTAKVADERRRADSCYRKLSEAVGARGVFVGRAPIDYHDFHMAQTMPAFRDACAAIKVALDPNGVIAPGRYGIAGKVAK